MPRPRVGVGCLDPLQIYRFQRRLGDTRAQLEDFYAHDLLVGVEIEDNAGLHLLRLDDRRTRPAEGRARRPHGRLGVSWQPAFHAPVKEYCDKARRRCRRIHHGSENAILALSDAGEVMHCAVITRFDEFWFIHRPPDPRFVDFALIRMVRMAGYIQVHQPMISPKRS